MRQRQTQINSGKTWTSGDLQKIRTLVRQKLSTKSIASKLRRTVDAVRKKASEKGISLKLKTKSSNGRKRH